MFVIGIIFLSIANAKQIKFCCFKMFCFSIDERFRRPKAIPSTVSTEFKLFEVFQKIIFFASETFVYFPP